MNTVHSDDVAGGLWAAAEWMSRVGRDEALKLAGEEIFFVQSCEERYMSVMD